VLVLERAGGGGGASAASGGALYLGGGTAIQQACGFEDSAEDMYRFLMLAMGPHADSERIACYADGSVEHFDWLVARGVPFKPTFWPEPAWAPPSDDGLMWMGEASYPFADVARPAPRGHRPRAPGLRGWLLMERLLATVHGSGVGVLTDTGAQRLLVDADGVVRGVVGRRYGEDVVLTASGGVILCGGGFVYNDEMLECHAPMLLGHGKIGTDNDDGLAIRMAIAAGATTRRMETGEAAINLPPALMARSILVNAHGQRFVNEDTYPGRIGQMTLFRQDARAYLVFDEHLYEEVPEIQRHGRVPGWVCATIAELEADIGLPAGCLETTVELYNRYAERGEDPLFHKQPKWVRPLRPPFGAMDVRSKPPDTEGVADLGTGFSVFTLGGVTTTVDGEALDIDGRVVPGLYAAGRTASGIHGWGYISGTSLGDGTFFGRRAGRSAALTGVRRAANLDSR
jgi:3-oxo-5alpha-steroid 4-dehydrogenase